MYTIVKTEFKRKGYENYTVNKSESIGYRDKFMLCVDHIEHDIKQYENKDHYLYDMLRGNRYRAWFRENGYEYKVVYSILEVVPDEK